MTINNNTKRKRILAIRNLVAQFDRAAFTRGLEMGKARTIPAITGAEHDAARARYHAAATECLRLRREINDLLDALN